MTQTRPRHVQYVWAMAMTFSTIRNSASIVAGNEDAPSFLRVYRASSLLTSHLSAIGMSSTYVALWSQVTGSARVHDSAPVCSGRY
jgi:hypothetical protein